MRLTTPRVMFTGLLSYTPLWNMRAKLVKPAVGGASSARYCYGVWLRHLVTAYDAGLRRLPEVILELGPGESIGVGLAALLCGASRYLAIDVVKYASTESNLHVFQELVALLKRGEDIPDDTEFPDMKPKIEQHSFPRSILDRDRMEVCLSDQRIESISDALMSPSPANPISINYVSPAYADSIIRSKSVGMIISQAVMEHVDNVEGAYRSMYKWLGSGGIMSHQIDFTSHDMSDYWNGHWTFSDLVWKMIRGKKSYLLNREPFSTHIKLQHKLGFKILKEIRIENHNGVDREKLSPKFVDMSEQDFCTSSALIVSTKNKP
ncbi:MAG: hypothetical protein ACLQJ7_08235 [Syntrophobacteraceae bacterium]